MKDNYKIEWDESFAWCIEEINEQHKDVIKSVNELYAACKNNTVKEVILSQIEKLDFYTTNHFETEENYAKEYGFDKLNELLSAHSFFKNVYREIKNYYTIYFSGDIIEYRYINMFALHLNQTLVEWLNVHLNTIDKELGEFLKNKITGN